MRLKKLGLISLSWGLLTCLIFPLPTQAQPKLSPNNLEIIIAQRFPNWSRIRIDEFFSILFPGDWKSEEDSVDSFFDRTYYTAFYRSMDSEIPELEGMNLCDVMNCKTFLAVATKEMAQEQGFRLRELKPVSVSIQGFPIDAVEFRASHLREPVEMIGRVLIIDDRMYFLAAATDSYYFDNNVEIFLESFSQ